MKTIYDKTNGILFDSDFTDPENNTVPTFTEGSTFWKAHGVDLLKSGTLHKYKVTCVHGESVFVEDVSPEFHKKNRAKISSYQKMKRELEAMTRMYDALKREAVNDITEVSNRKDTGGKIMYKWGVRGIAIKMTDDIDHQIIHGSFDNQGNGLYDQIHKDGKD